MNSNIFMNGLGDEVFIMDDQVDVNLLKVLPDVMNNLQQKRYQQPQMVPDVVRREGLDYEVPENQEFNPARHIPGCQCDACRERRMMEHLQINDMMIMQNHDRKFVIDLKTYAFDTQSTMQCNHTTTLLRLFNDRSVPVLSKKYSIRLLYTIISTDEDGYLITTQDGAIQSDSKRDFYLTKEQDAEGFWTYMFMDLHNSDVITIPTMYGAAGVTLNLRGIEIYAQSTGYSLDIKPDGNLVYTNTGIKDILIYKDMFGEEYRGYAYPVMPHDRVRINFSCIFNNITSIPDLTKIKHILHGLDYRTCDFDTVPSWNKTHLWTGTDVNGSDFILTIDPRLVEDIVSDKLDAILIPELSSKGDLKHAV